MKHHTVLALFTFLLLGFSGFAQLKTAGIYDFEVQVEDSIYNDRQEEEILDTLKKMTTAKMANILNAGVDCVYWTNKRGKVVVSPNVFGTIGGLPNSTFKKAVQQHERDLYIAITCRIFAKGGRKIFYGNQKAMDIAPLVGLKVTVYDKQKKIVWQKAVQRGDFENLRDEAQRQTVVGKLLSNSLFGKPTYINAAEVLYMYTRTLEWLN